MTLKGLASNTSWGRFIIGWVAIYVVEDGYFDHLTVYVDCRTSSAAKSHLNLTGALLIEPIIHEMLCCGALIGAIVYKLT